MPATIPGASLSYEALLPLTMRSLRERSSPYASGFHWTERHLQCIWFDERLRPKELKTLSGETIMVESPGRWNLEAGPDFVDARLRVGAEQRRLAGDVELHVRPTDWDRHRHDRTGLYANVILHVTYFAGPSAATAAGILHLPLSAALSAVRDFSFDDVDLAAYPHAVLPLTPRPCGTALASQPDRWAPLLASAGLHRLQIKSRRLAERLNRSGDLNQLLFEETLAALGYKHNTAVFRRLAQRLPVAAWDSHAPVEQTYARMLGVLGLLPDIERAEDDESRRFGRKLWDGWWRDPVTAVEGETWPVLRHSTRPLNAPERRLAAAAALFAGPTALHDLVKSVSIEPAKSWFKRMAACLTNCLESTESLAFSEFWRWHITLTGKRQPRSATLLGAPRLSAILANVVVPLLLARDEQASVLANHLPSEDVSAPMRETANALFSRDHNPALYATSGLLQQGLLQIHQDFCLNARGGCGECALARALNDT